MKVLFSIAFLLVACGSGKAQHPDVGPAGGGDFVLASLPAETRVILHVDVTKLRAAKPLLALVGQELDRDPDAHARLVELFGRCKLDPAADLDEITLGMNDADEVALLARGKLDEKALVSCVKAELAAEGGTLGVTDRPGTPPRVYSAITKSGQKAWFAFGPHSVAVATAEAWLIRLIDAKTPRLETREDTMALVKRVDPKAALWGVGYPPAGIGEQLVKLGGLSGPATAISFEVAADKGLVAALRMDLKSDADATKMAALVRSQMDWLAIAAQRVGLGTLIAKAKTTSERNVVKLSLQLDEAELDRLVAALAPPKVNEKEKKEP